MCQRCQNLKRRVGLPETTERVEWCQCTDEFRLVVAIAETPMRGVDRNAGRILPSKASLGLRTRWVGLKRQRMPGRKNLQQERQAAKLVVHRRPERTDGITTDDLVKRHPIRTRQRRRRGVSAEPQLGPRAAVWAAEERRQPRSTPS